MSSSDIWAVETTGARVFDEAVPSPMALAESQGLDLLALDELGSCHAKKGRTFAVAPVAKAMEG